jgi:hypothetical protein
MKSFLIIISVFTLFTLISCSPAKKDSGQAQQVPVLPPTQEQSAPAGTEPHEPVVIETATQPSPEQHDAEIMLNPPHGEPFHRCEIPVGAPLNSAPTQQITNNPVQSPSPQTQNIANNPFAPTVENAARMNSSQARSRTAPATGTKPRLNPPHGEPWHRCDIAVGSPLP